MPQTKSSAPASASAALLSGDPPAIWSVKLFSPPAGSVESHSQRQINAKAHDEKMPHSGAAPDTKQGATLPWTRGRFTDGSILCH